MKPASHIEEEAIRTVRELKGITANIKKLKAETETIDRLIHELKEGQALNEQDLKHFGLAPQPHIMLKLRLKGIQATRKATLSEQQYQLRDRKELLKDLTKCPACKGQGTTIKRAYDRGNGKVTQLVKTELCGQCGGTGRAELSDHVKDLIRSLPLDEY